MARFGCESVFGWSEKQHNDCFASSSADRASRLVGLVASLSGSGSTDYSEGTGMNAPILRGGERENRGPAALDAWR
jgi:hypothetical protein